MRLLTLLSCLSALWLVTGPAHATTSPPSGADQEGLAVEILSPTYTELFAGVEEVVLRLSVTDASVVTLQSLRPVVRYEIFDRPDAKRTYPCQLGAIQSDAGRQFVLASCAVEVADDPRFKTMYVEVFDDSGDEVFRQRLTTGDYGPADVEAYENDPRINVMLRGSASAIERARKTHRDWNCRVRDVRALFNDNHYSVPCEVSKLEKLGAPDVVLLEILIGSSGNVRQELVDMREALRELLGEIADAGMMVHAEIVQFSTTSTPVTGGFVRLDPREPRHVEHLLTRMTGAADLGFAAGAASIPAGVDIDIPDLRRWTNDVIGATLRGVKSLEKEIARNAGQDVRPLMIVLTDWEQDGPSNAGGDLIAMASSPEGVSTRAIESGIRILGFGGRKALTGSQNVAGMARTTGGWLITSLNRSEVMAEVLHELIMETWEARITVTLDDIEGLEPEEFAKAARKRREKFDKLTRGAAGLWLELPEDGAVLDKTDSTDQTVDDSWRRQVDIVHPGQLPAPEPRFARELAGLRDDEISAKGLAYVVANARNHFSPDVLTQKKYRPQKLFQMTFDAVDEAITRQLELELDYLEAAHDSGRDEIKALDRYLRRYLKKKRRGKEKKAAQSDFEHWTRRLRRLESRGRSIERNMGAVRRRLENKDDAYPEFEGPESLAHRLRILRRLSGVTERADILPIDEADAADFLIEESMHTLAELSRIAHMWEERLGGDVVEQTQAELARLIDSGIAPELAFSEGARDSILQLSQYQAKLLRQAYFDEAAEHLGADTRIARNALLEQVVLAWKAENASTEHRKLLVVQDLYERARHDHPEGDGQVGSSATSRVRLAELERRYALIRSLLERASQPRL